MIDINKIRSETAGCRDKIFFNSAGSSLVSDQVYSAATDYLAEERIIGGYEAAAKYHSQLQSFYTESARLLGCAPANVAYVNSATDGYGKVLSSIAWADGDLILTTAVDYVSNYLQFMSLQKRYGVRMMTIPTLPSGDLDISAAESIMDHNAVTLVAVTHIPTNSGLVQDVAAIGQLISSRGISYLVDGCQAVGQLYVNVTDIKCDYYVTSGRKFMRGPRGTGLLYVSDRVLASDSGPMTHDAMGSTWTTATTYRVNPDATRYELFEHSMANRIGFVKAIQQINEVGIQNIESYTTKLAARLREGLSELDCRVLDHGSKLCGIVTFVVNDYDTDQLSHDLQEQKVSHSVARLASAMIDFEQKGVTAAIRLSPHYFNTEEEVAKVLTILSTLTSR